MTTFERLEVLLFLHKSAPEAFTNRSIGEQLRIPEEIAHETLVGLHSSGLVERSGTGTPLFRFAPASDELREVVRQLGIAYTEQGAAILSAMSMNAIERIRSGPMRAFSDSFVLGKKEK